MKVIKKYCLPTKFMDFKSKYARVKKEHGHQDSRLSGFLYGAKLKG